ncbi:MAG: NADH-quinone oxidoreductase subunit A [Candidatus Eisenbacteria bacterium]|uniref:NADH-quinone oxidoreductase subunit A n=1 Tax=Eiseniibacteriota bacterium TaxID=2212470 RepID=A0A538TS49_UNCEI|nr:MAG: NADH-quinone oxidoreductase subunit A [Candidatus Eisenbacteria bacterium]TMQ66450.1 MAG: NADH-quinone oxidoreductase subunit A [Candidatus Eisenbacteria bacterium]
MNQVDPNSTTAFLPILMMLIVAIGFAVFTLVASHFLGTRVNDPAKLSPYECGITPTGSARERFHTRFYLVAMLFIVFDIETVFLYPWAIVFKQLRIFGLIEMAVFVGILLLGLVYVWGKGALEWD